MGGIGSGRRYHSGAKGTVDSRVSVDIHYLNKTGSLSPGRAGTLSWSRNGQQTSMLGFRVSDEELTLNYATDGQSFSYAVPFVYSPCNYGGRRTWFQCPGCCSRVGKITLSDKMFVCRNCGKLAYQSQRENTQHRLSSKAQILRKRLGGSLGALDPIPWKPKGMHWKTYRKIRGQIDIYEFAMMGSISASMSAFVKKFSALK